MATELVNCTPHVVTFLGSDDQTLLEVPPSGQLARCTPTTQVVGSIEIEAGSIPLRETVMGDVTGLPAPQSDIIYVVSRIVAEASGRPDLLIVDDTVRGEGGQIVGCRALARLPRG